MIGDIDLSHYAQLLKINEEFVHWLAPMDEAKLKWVLSLADYARQIDGAQAVLIGYSHKTDYPDHWNLNWLRRNFDNFFYIDRIIVDAAAQGKGYGKILYEDVANFARAQGHTYLCCEVNTVPDNLGSHKFHLALGFKACGDHVIDPETKAVRYYAKTL